ncbi:hypothetical protein C8A03DRAFT_19052 [Achaetomium macrosporum]|uniref:Xylanolytic transcriptional activator regulatory domain-containing protein n=1 Tax=Achaetomium macrosporum TaxID=79813 RepID=A0AAN7C290_9PEZI|nr:hypothetical protein C8A03DRAFT_19052 [Achaetomium macrosporum]
MQPFDQPLDEIDPRVATLLPPRQFADDLLRWYWVYVHSIFPFLHWPMFKARYYSLWKQKAPPGNQEEAFEDLLFLSTVNMVLALACLRNELMIPIELRQHYGEEFYRRSLRLISAETLDTASLSVVQLLLLRALYLYFGGRADRCWLVSGAALRVAIGLGLHVAAKRRALNQIEGEMRLRVWHGGCVPLDQVLATTFGRPGMIYPGLSQTPLPLAIGEEYLSATDEGRQPEGIPSRMDFIIFGTKIFEVLEEMRAVQRAPLLKITQSGNEFSIPEPSSVLRVNSRIEELLESRPLHLRHDTDLSTMGLDEDTMKCFQHQCGAIRFRILTLRVFLLRPSLLAEAHRWTTSTAGAKPTPSSMLHERLHLEICSLCLDTVHTMLEDIHRTMATSAAILSSWYSLHFTAASAAVLIVATLSPKLGVSLDTEPLKSSWDRAMAIFEFHKAHVASAGRAMEVLIRFRESITLRARARLGMLPSTPHQQCLPPQQYQQGTQQPYRQPPAQTWDPSQAIPSPLSMGAGGTAGLMEGLDEFLTSDSLNEAWLSTQDWGQGNWMLHY